MNSINSQKATFGFSLFVRKARKANFLIQMDSIVPWYRLVDLIAPNYLAGHTDRPTFGLEMTLCYYFLQQWFNSPNSTLKRPS